MVPAGPKLPPNTSRVSKMDKDIEKLILAQLRAEEKKNSTLFPSGIIYKSGIPESQFSKSKKGKK